MRTIIRDVFMPIMGVFIRTVARLGYAARGLVYLVVGGLAFEAALDLEQARDIRGAMHTIVAQQFGVPVLLAIAVGLLAYSAWRVLQSILDVDNHGFNARGLGVRLALLISAGMHIALAIASVQIALNIGSGDGTPTRAYVEKIFTLPLGRWWVAAGGVAVLIAGVAHLYKGVTAGYRRWFDASPAVMWWVDPVSRTGLIARGLLFFPVGCFAIYAAITFNAGEARGLEGALLWLEELAFGRLLLAIIGIGLMAFGAYSCIEAGVRRVGLDRGRAGIQ